MTVAGKRIVVTGGARGIGAELAAELRSRGADVVTADISDGADVRCDVSDAAAVDTAFSELGLARRTGQQRGPARQPQEPRPDRARRVGPHVRRQRQGRVPVRPGGRAGDERRRQHRERRVGDGIHRLARIRPLRRVEGCGGVAHAGPRQRARRTRHPGQLRRARVHADARLGACSARTTRRARRSAASWSHPTCSARSATCCRTTRRSCRVRRSSSTADECRTDQSERWSTDGRIRRSRRHRPRRARAPRRREADRARRRSHRPHGSAESRRSTR